MDAGEILQKQSWLLTDATASTGLTEMNGMWRSLIAADVDQDGDIDLVAGNLGLNCDYQASPSAPMQLYATDLDGNGSIDPVFFYYIKGMDGEKHSFPGISRGQFSEQAPFIKKKFLRHSDYAQADYDDIFRGKNNGLKLIVKKRGVCISKIGNGKVVKHPLPMEAQFAPVNAIICDDLDNDGFKDLLWPEMNTRRM